MTKQRSMTDCHLANLLLPSVRRAVWSAPRERREFYEQIFVTESDGQRVIAPSVIEEADLDDPGVLIEKLMALAAA